MMLWADDVPQRYDICPAPPDMDRHAAFAAAGWCTCYMKHSQHASMLCGFVWPTLAVSQRWQCNSEFFLHCKFHTKHHKHAFQCQIHETANSRKGQEQCSVKHHQQCTVQVGKCFPALCKPHAPMHSAPQHCAVCIRDRGDCTCCSCSALLLADSYCTPA